MKWLLHIICAATAIIIAIEGVEAADIQVLDWRDTIMLEHQDRMNRIVRLTSHLPSQLQPRFEEYVVDKERLPLEFGVSIPVLRVIFPQRVFFDTDSSSLRAEAHDWVAIVAENMRREPPDVALFVAGHTDSRASHAYNQNLSIDRANTVAQELVDEGTGFTTVWRIGFGEELPLASNHSSRGQGLNRRVEFLFAAKRQAAAVWLANQLDIVCSGEDARSMKRCRKSISITQAFEAVEILSSRDVLSPVYKKQSINVTAPKRVAIQIRQPRRIRVDPINRVSEDIKTVDLDEKELESQ